MGIINAIGHLVAFTLLLLMYFRMYTTKNVKGKAKLLSWWALKLSLVITICVHLGAAIALFSDKLSIPLWLNISNWLGTFICLAWAEVVHNWKNIPEIRKEFNHLKHRKAHSVE